VDELEPGKCLTGRKGGETAQRRCSVKITYGVSDDDDEAEDRLFNDSEEGEEDRDAGLASDATWAKR